MKHTLLNTIAALTAALVCSCTNDKGTVTIEGNVADAAGEKLALMHLSGTNPVLVDTLRLGEGGQFKFQPKVEKGGPDFFCLVLGDQTIPVISDTLQTPVKITTSKEKFATAYTVEDSLNNVFKQALGLSADFRRSIINLSTERSQGKISQPVYADSIDALIANYKQQALSDYIFADPASPVSYYLLFETVAGLQIFNTVDMRDSRAFGAVANLWNAVYPNSPRTAYLTQQAYEGQLARRQMRLSQEHADSLVQHGITESNFIDISLYDNGDRLTPLSSINGKGDVVLLDFTAYYSDASVAHNMALQKVYDTYKDRGLKIYQICLDFDENFWKVGASNVPWTVVRDRDVLYDENAQIQYSPTAALYNVQQIPEVFIMGRDGAAVARVADDSQLEAAVAKVMK